MMYFVLILFSMLWVYAYTIPLALCVDFFPISEALCGPMIINAFVLVLMGIVCLCMRIFVPAKSWNYKKQIFSVRKKQYSLIKKLRICQWKDSVPEMGWTSNFPKDKVYSFEKNYLEKFLQETCFAEMFHIVSGLLAFLVLPFMSFRSYVYAFPLLVVNLVLHTLPCLIQRYVRFKLARIYEKKLVRDQPQKRSEL